MKASVGFNVFLYTDMGGNKAVYSDTELVDWLQVSYQFTQPYILLSLNATMREVAGIFPAADLPDGQLITFNIGRSTFYEEADGRTVSFSIPRNTKHIRVYRPMRPMSNDREEVSAEEYFRMMEII
jgi:hypothetical protein